MSPQGYHEKSVQLTLVNSKEYGFIKLNEHRALDQCPWLRYLGLFLSRAGFLKLAALEEGKKETEKGERVNE